MDWGIGKDATGTEGNICCTRTKTAEKFFPPFALITQLLVR